MQHRLDLAVDKELVAENSICIEQIEFEQPSLVIEDLIVDDHVDIETGEWILSIAETWQSKARVFVTSVEFVEENVGACETLVRILRRVVDAMIVIPQGVHRFFDIAGAGMC